MLSAKWQQFCHSLNVLRTHHFHVYFTHFWQNLLMYMMWEFDTSLHEVSLHRLFHFRLFRHLNCFLNTCNTIVKFSSGDPGSAGCQTNTKIFIRGPVCNTHDSWLAPSQWETSLQSNVVSHWLGADLESALKPNYIPHCGRKIWCY